MKTILSMLVLIAMTSPHVVHAKASVKANRAVAAAEEADFNPFDPKAEEQLKLMDEQYKKETGLNAIITVPQDTDHADGEELLPQLEIHPAVQADPNQVMTPANPQATPENILPPGFEAPAVPAQPAFPEGLQSQNCRRMECHVFIDVERSKQVLNLYVDGVLTLTSPTSTGRPGFATPNFDTNPNGRIYQIYSSSKYPGYNNMPFAIFIQGGFAIHGAPGSEDAQLGRVASHGCVRVRTSKAQEINRIVSQAVKEAGGSTKTVWITVRP